MDKHRELHDMLVTQGAGVEKWKPVEGYEGYYEVSNHGRLKMLPAMRKDGKQRPERIIHGCKNSRGYMTCRLYSPRMEKSRTIHSIVAVAWCPKQDYQTEVNHRDLDKTNNHPDNLEWCSRTENNQHAARNGHHNTAILNPVIVRIIRRCLQFGMRQKDIGKAFGVPQNTISNVSTGSRWSHVRHQGELHAAVKPEARDGK
jgi:hypothetical protein